MLALPLLFQKQSCCQALFFCFSVLHCLRLAIVKYSRILSRKRELSQAFHKSKRLIPFIAKRIHYILCAEHRLTLISYEITLSEISTVIDIMWRYYKYLFSLRYGVIDIIKTMTFLATLSKSTAFESPVRILLRFTKALPNGL